ncbi:HET-domain-containing protein, partial [Pleurotus eryngii]
MDFFFSTIPLESGEIRLLRLASKEQDAPGLRGELFVTPLFRPPDFTALSYTWGDPGVRSEILINGSAKLSITTSLQVALLASQREDAPVTLWIDQICINQDDAREKAIQVPLMSQIYSRASQTIAWLGPAADGSDLVIDFLDSIGSEGVEVGLQDLTNEDTKDILAHAAADPGWLHRSPSSLEPTSSMEALIRKLALRHGEYVLPLRLERLAFFERPYFERGWVKQEVAIPSRLIFQCGRKTISADVFDAAMNFYFTHFQIADALLKLNRSSMTVDEYKPIAEIMAAPDAAFDVIKPVIHNRNWYHNSEKRKIQTLGYLIHKYRSRPQFADRRDRIYGLLGLACDADTLGIEVDYTKTWEEVYTDATKRIINRGKIDVLSMVEYPKTSSRLPSWVSDLNVTRRDSILRDVTVTSIRPFAAAASTSHLPPLDSDEQPRILTCRGVIVDRMHEVGRQWALKEDGVSRSPLGALLPCSDIINYIATPMVSNHPHAASPARRAEAAWRIPVIDHEYIDASVGTSRRTTTVSRHAYDEVKNMLLWSNALLLGQDIAEVIPLTDEQSEELEHVGPQEHEARATQMRIARLRLSAP